MKDHPRDSQCYITARNLTNRGLYKKFGEDGPEKTVPLWSARTRRRSSKLQLNELSELRDHSLRDSVNNHKRSEDKENTRFQDIDIQNISNVGDSSLAFLLRLRHFSGGKLSHVGPDLHIAVVYPYGTLFCT
ncbi:hypothetical protein Tco_1400780 [Tanacetum coccineum]